VVGSLRLEPPQQSFGFTVQPSVRPGPFHPTLRVSEKTYGNFGAPPRCQKRGPLLAQLVREQYNPVACLFPLVVLVAVKKPFCPVSSGVH
jgi:hypothetical protein